MTGDRIPERLTFVHLRFHVEGKAFERIFEADPNLEYTFPWDRLNVYKQKVYGTTEATGRPKNCATVLKK